MFLQHEKYNLPSEFLKDATAEGVKYNTIFHESINDNS